MDDPTDVPAIKNISAQRVTEFLENLVAEGKNHRVIASLLGVPVQYLSDFKHGQRRRLTLPMARRFEEAFGVHAQWLLGQSDVRETECSNNVVKAIDGMALKLPVFSHPIEGDASCHPKWDGTFAEIVGAAAAKIAVAKQPYILRFDADDVENRVVRGDMLLMSQANLPVIADMESVIQVIRHGRGLYLARRKATKWRRLAKAHADPITENCTVHGHAMGIIWGSLT